jgi:hypothetical protein
VQESATDSTLGDSSEFVPNGTARASFPGRVGKYRSNFDSELSWDYWLDEFRVDDLSKVKHLTAVEGVSQDVPNSVYRPTFSSSWVHLTLPEVNSKTSDGFSSSELLE